MRLSRRGSVSNKSTAHFSSTLESIRVRKFKRWSMITFPQALRKVGPPGSVRSKSTPTQKEIMKSIGLPFAVVLSLTVSACASTTNTNTVATLAGNVVAPVDIMGARLRIGDGNGTSQTLEGDHDSIGGGEGHL